MKKIKIILSCVLALWATALSAQSWSDFDYHQYQYDMTIYYTLKGTPLKNYSIAAFVDGECRGVGEVVTAEGSNGVSLTYGLLKVYSNATSGETVTFKYFNKKENKEVVVPNASVSFTSQGVEGMPSAPFELDLGVYLKMGDANCDGSVNTIDIVDIVNYLTGKSSSTDQFSEEAADMNEYGNIDAADIVQIVNDIMTTD